MQRLLFVILAGVAVLSLALASHAEALTVSPARLEVEGMPGVRVDAEFTVINEEAQSRTFYLSSENFEAQGETGAPNFVPGTEGLASWIDVMPQVTLAPREARTIPFAVNIPAGAEPGGNFAAVFLSTSAPVVEGEEGSQVSVGAKIGVLVLLRVLGDVREGGGLIEFDTADKQHMFSALPVNFYYRFQNTGADRVRPEGTLKIKNMLGMTAAELDANPTEGNVLPSSIRRFELSWGGDAARATTTPGFFGAAAYQLKHFAFGRYAAQLDFAYGENG